MASHARSVLGDLLTALRASHAHFDLSTSSSTPRVVIGEAMAPPVTAPMVYLSAPRVVSEYGQAHISAYDVTGTITWIGFVASDSLDAAERVLDALDLADDVATAIEDAHHNSSYTTLYGLHRLLVTVDDAIGEGQDMPDGYGIVLGTITYRVLLSRGV